MIEKSWQGITPPHIASGNTSVYAQYTILVNNREEVIARFKEADIPTAVHYPIPLNKQPALQTSEFELSVAEELSDKVMSLPMHPYLSEVDQDRVVEILEQQS